LKISKKNYTSLKNLPLS